MSYVTLERHYRTTITAIAMKLAGTRDLMVLSDLKQIGRITLWRLKVRRATRNKDAYIRAALRNKMIDYLRTLHTDRLVSLDSCLERGYDVVQDWATQEPRLLRYRGQDSRHGGVAWSTAEVDWGQPLRMPTTPVNGVSK